jgi:hypothetical protein
LQRSRTTPLAENRCRTSGAEDGRALRELEQPYAVLRSSRPAPYCVSGLRDGHTPSSTRPRHSTSETRAVSVPRLANLESDTPVDKRWASLYPQSPHTISDWELASCDSPESVALSLALVHTAMNHLQRTTLGTLGGAATSTPGSVVVDSYAHRLKSQDVN